MKAPNFFIVGAAKAGTTALSTYLREHPRVFFSQPKEPHFFATDFPGLQVVSDERAYLALFEGADDRHLAVGEASTSSMYSTEAIARIRQFDPDARIIVLLRNPVDLVHAAHAQLLHLRDETERNFDVAWSLCSQRKQGRSVPRTCRTPELLYYDELARFGQQLSRVYAHFPREQVRVILFEELSARTAEVYRSTLSFLGLPDDQRSSFERVNENRRHRSAWFGHFLMHPPAPLVAMGEALKPALGISRLGLLRRLRPLNDVVEPRRPMKPSTRSEIIENYRADIDGLSQLLDLDLTGRWLDTAACDEATCRE